MSFGQPLIIPRPIHHIHSLSKIDYGDQFSISANTSRTAEQWMRTIFGEVPNLRHKFIWQGLLGFTLDPSRSPDVIAGNRITGRGHDWIRVENSSKLLSANIICKASMDEVSVITLVQYNHWFAKWWWPLLAVIHRKIVPKLLRQAVNRDRRAQ